MKMKAVSILLATSLLGVGIISSLGVSNSLESPQDNIIESNNNATNEDNKVNTTELVTESKETSSTDTNAEDNTKLNATTNTSNLVSNNNTTNPKPTISDQLDKPQVTQPTTPPVTTPPVTTPPATTPPNPESNVAKGSFISAIEQEIFSLVNAERSNAGLPALMYNSTMEKYARIKSSDMGDKDYFAHEDLQGNLITTQMKADGVNYQAWGENIAYISGSTSAIAQRFMTNWMNSSGHRANILSSNFTGIGVGVYKIGNKYYATQEFYR